MVTTGCCPRERLSPPETQRCRDSRRSGLLPSRQRGRWHARTVACGSAAGDEGTKALVQAGIATSFPTSPETTIITTTSSSLVVLKLSVLCSLLMS